MIKYGGNPDKNHHSSIEVTVTLIDLRKVKYRSDVYCPSENKADFKFQPNRYVGTNSSPNDYILTADRLTADS